MIDFVVLLFFLCMSPKLLQQRCFGVINSTANENGWRFEQLLQDEQMLPLIELLRNVTWTLSNFCRGKPQPNIKYIKDAIEALTIMLTLPDTEILQDAAWGFSYLSDSDDIGSLTQSNNNKNNKKNNSSEGREGQGRK